ncbi:hypothetical protein MSAN_01033300 [Mycena sanguinolenta]|uniref:Uncharacterized protein n=1 Tax=Mycena sanguinolenta TaxID=230812 RepID=A0A8H6YTT4_9AGAR|nr:hypothetical protein MSAN_01033300 [Mycena sanguinolenta]
MSWNEDTREMQTCDGIEIVAHGRVQGSFIYLLPLSLSFAATIRRVMPATSLQSRISAFESLSNPHAALQKPLSPRIIPSTPPRASPSPSPPNLGRKSSLIDFKIDLKDWVLDDGSPPRSNGFKKTPTQASFNGEDALIHFSPPKPSSVKAPPLPPRKPSLASLKSTASLPVNKNPPSLPPPTRRGDSLTVEHTYPPLELSPPRGHTHGSSISSFHSVSLSDRSPSPSPTAAVHTTEHTTGSSAESFEELSASAALASPTTTALISQDWERAMARRQPPKLPARPPPTTTVSPPPDTPSRTSTSIRPRIHTELHVCLLFCLSIDLQIHPLQRQPYRRINCAPAPLSRLRRDAAMTRSSRPSSLRMPSAPRCSHRAGVPPRAGAASPSTSSATPWTTLAGNRPGPRWMTTWTRSRGPSSASCGLARAFLSRCSPPSGTNAILDGQAHSTGRRSPGVCGALTRNSDGRRRVGRTRTGAGGAVCGEDALYCL